MSVFNTPIIMLESTHGVVVVSNLIHVSGVNFGSNHQDMLLVSGCFLIYFLEVVIRLFIVLKSDFVTCELVSINRGLYFNRFPHDRFTIGSSNLSLREGVHLDMLAINEGSCVHARISRAH